jgi:MFS family permease
MGIYVGAGLAGILGGLVVEIASAQDQLELPVLGATRPWQVIFFAVGLPGLLVALLLGTVREPARRGVHKTALSQVPLRDVTAYIRDNRTTFLCLNLGVAWLAFSGYGASAWVPTFFIRQYGWTAGQAGIGFGLIVAIAGTLGIVAGGRLADALHQQGHADAELRVALLAALAWLPFGVLYPLMPSGAWAAALLTPATFCSSVPFGVAPAAIQHMMPNSLRAQASALYLFVINLIGLGLGPTAVAMATDRVFRDDRAVGLSLLFVGGLAQLAAAAFLWRGLKPYRHSLDYLKQWNHRQTQGP